MKGSVSLGLHFTFASALVVEGYSDADWASCPDGGRSTGGHCVYVGGNLVIWNAKQEVVSRSSAESEYRSLANLSTDVIWLKAVCDEIGVSIAGTPKLWCDNTSAIALAANHVFHGRTKHIEVDVHFIREKVLGKVVEVGHVPTEDQVADLFTKPLRENRSLLLRERLKLKLLEHG